MLLPTIFLSLCAVVGVAMWVRRLRRRREQRDMIVTTWPDIELSQRYGGWDADAYDAGTGRDRGPRAISHRPGEVARLGATPRPGSQVRRPH